uniref:Aminoglycoside phosphotransferase domain-containing protein n=1 Tax=Chromera velia CCMP2878 TaxID=1169474 RepID=A0A0G4GI51_9ALVE|eukprot:Cvel_21942.t1-p1 / transcript=Cvel_21942.t1 / gene=Cvel_21942 / organism=Chromera_velia_CCMP2878 / gene_product=Ethanolamine-phosphate phospho-lyase, putative / transcript_product=Ethanolamine-phosphate phospho-lyase, putative / location=Cvel_scaffold2106:10328-17879(+) / protein_length=1399 / sequence_SO=supercontig / SO=protein_coding / is_pseudo=false
MSTLDFVPQFSDEEAQELLRLLYGERFRVVKALPSERDQNFKATEEKEKTSKEETAETETGGAEKRTRGRNFVFKIANATDSLEMLECQNEAMLRQALAAASEKREEGPEAKGPDRSERKKTTGPTPVASSSSFGGVFVLGIERWGLEEGGAKESDSVGECKGRSSSTLRSRIVTGIEMLRCLSSKRKVHLIRLVTFVEGAVLAEFCPHSRGLLCEFGRSIARVDGALADFDHPALHGEERSEFPWDLQNGIGAVRRLMSEKVLSDGEDAKILEAFMGRIEGRRRRKRLRVGGHRARQREENQEDVFGELPKAAVHNDANDYNVIVNVESASMSLERGGEGFDVALIDWGDICWSYRCADLAIAIAYVMLDKPKPLMAAAAVVEGFHSVLPLSDTECDALFDLAVLRLCTSVCMSAFQRAKNPDNAYLSVSEKGAWECLRRLFAEVDVIHEIPNRLFRFVCGYKNLPEQKLEMETGAFSPLITVSSAFHVDLSVGSPLVPPSPFFFGSFSSLETLVSDLEEKQQAVKELTHRILNLAQSNGGEALKSPVVAGVSGYGEGRLCGTQPPQLLRLLGLCSPLCVPQLNGMKKQSKKEGEMEGERIGVPEERWDSVGKFALQDSLEEECESICLSREVLLIHGEGDGNLAIETISSPNLFSQSSVVHIFSPRTSVVEGVEEETSGGEGDGTGMVCVSLSVFDTPWRITVRGLRLAEVQVEAGQKVEEGSVVAAVELNSGNKRERGIRVLSVQQSDALVERTKIPSTCAPAWKDFWRGICPDPLPFLLSLSKNASDKEVPKEGEDAWRKGERAFEGAPTGDEMNHRLMEIRRNLMAPNLSVSYSRSPLHIVRGVGSYLMDSEGRVFLDCVNNVAHTGHCDPFVSRALQCQMEVLNTNTRYLHETLLSYAQKLSEVFPPALSKVFMVCSGTEANELALRLATCASAVRRKRLCSSTERGAPIRVVEGEEGKDNVPQERTKGNSNKRSAPAAFACIDHGYHGNSQGCVDVSPYKYNAKGGPGEPSWVLRLPLPDGCRGPFRFPYGSPDYSHSKPGEEDEETRAGRAYGIEAAERIRQWNRANPQMPLCGVVHESFLGCGGQVPLPRAYLDEVYEAIREGGGVAIADEVQTGFGRCGGKEGWWSFEPLGLVPDVVSMGKPIGNGHPVGAVVTTAEIAEAFASGPEYFNTFGGNPVSCAVASAVLDRVRGEAVRESSLTLKHSGEEEGDGVNSGTPSPSPSLSLSLRDAADETGRYLWRRLEGVRERHPIVSSVRGRGLFFGIELSKPAPGGLEMKAEAHSSLGRDADCPGEFSSSASSFGEEVLVPATREASYVSFRLRQRGVLVSTDGPFENVLKIKPPLVFGPQEADILVGALEEVLKESPLKVEMRRPWEGCGTRKSCKWDDCL